MATKTEKKAKAIVETTETTREGNDRPQRRVGRLALKGAAKFGI